MNFHVIKTALDTSEFASNPQYFIEKNLPGCARQPPGGRLITLDPSTLKEMIYPHTGLDTSKYGFPFPSHYASASYIISGLTECLNHCMPP